MSKAIEVMPCVGDRVVVPGLLHLGGTRDKHGESGTDYFLLARYTPESDDKFPTKESVIAYLDGEDTPLPGSRCGCEHDCCGCVNTHATNIVAYDDIHENWIITQSWARNL